MLRKILIALMLSVLIILEGAGIANAQYTTPATVDSTVRAPSMKETKLYRAVNIALNQVGDPYKYGAAGPNAFDCSGLIYYSYRRAGFTNIPRTAAAQAKFTRRISLDNKRRGDLLFYYGNSGVYHVAIYIGNNRIVHATRTGEPVKVDPVWQARRFAGTLR